MIKITYSIQWKIPGWLCFSGQAQVAQKFWMWKVYSIQRKIPGQLCFSGQAQVVQKSWMVKNIFNIEKNFRGNSVFRAIASCYKSWM